jgi:hypothetical protein
MIEYIVAFIAYFILGMAFGTGVGLVIWLATKD